MFSKSLTKEQKQIRGQRLERWMKKRGFSEVEFRKLLGYKSEVKNSLT